MSDQNLVCVCISSPDADKIDKFCPSNPCPESRMNPSHPAPLRYKSLHRTYVFRMKLTFITTFSTSANYIFENICISISIDISFRRCKIQFCVDGAASHTATHRCRQINGVATDGCMALYEYVCVCAVSNAIVMGC